MYAKAGKLPLGKKIFSAVFSRKAPYFGTINPLITELRPNFCELRFAKRRAVENHIGTVHVIAICNGLEMAMGAVAEASIPKHLRWIPKGMDVRYTAKATTDIRITAEANPEDWKPGDLPVTVKAFRDDGTVVVEGTIMLYVSEKPTK
ncbi:hotdog fold domain-containing protein [Alcanivorax sp. 1008]|uniref:hotdog fold domain-containing protein n=1 Tax=Alcanivorax sp. 1008 TaxID=2816853 RepID=UPI001E39FC72|nr:hotdog fold domain-containing protein [Alcanivorax sp. 1008]